MWPLFPVKRRNICAITAWALEWTVGPLIRRPTAPNRQPMTSYFCFQPVCSNRASSRKSYRTFSAVFSHQDEHLVTLLDHLRLRFSTVPRHMARQCEQATCSSLLVRSSRTLRRRYCATQSALGRQARLYRRATYPPHLSRHLRLRRWTPTGIVPSTRGWGGCAGERWRGAVQLPFTARAEAGRPLPERASALSRGGPRPDTDRQHLPTGIQTPFARENGLGRLRPALERGPSCRHS